MTKKEVISLTGHRPKDLFGYNIYSGSYNSIRRRLTEILTNKMVTNDEVEAHTGLALGADTIWGEEVLRFKAILSEDSKKELSLWAEIPHPLQAEAWKGDKDKATWNLLVNSSTGKTLYSEEYTPWCLNERNKGMLNVADTLIAVWNGKLSKKSGTSNAIKHWGKLNKETMLVLRPQDDFIRLDLIRNQGLFNSKDLPTVRNKNEMNKLFENFISSKRSMSTESVYIEPFHVFTDSANEKTLYELKEEREEKDYNLFTIKKYLIDNRILVNKENKTFKVLK